jgi:hypothetical protein
MTSDELEGRVLDKQSEYYIFRVNLESILAQSRCILGRPLLAPIYRWPVPKESVEFDTNLLLQCGLQYDLVL